MKICEKLFISILIFAVLSFFIYRVGDILMPFIISLVVAYFLRPLVDYFADKKIPDALAIFLIMVTFFAIISAIFYLTLPIIYEQSSSMIQAIPSYLQIFKSDFYPKYLAVLHKNGIFFDADFEEFFNNYNLEILDLAKNFTFKIFSSTSSIINVLSIFFVMPILIFYLLKDWNILENKIKEYFPKNSSYDIAKNLTDVDKALSGYIRGQSLVCLFMALIYGFSLSLTGLNFGFLIGFLTGVFAFIPYIGAIIGFGVAIVVALFQWGFNFIDILPVILVIIVGQIIESNFLTPKLIGKKIGLHPAWVIFGIFIFGSLFGFVGVIFATPLTAVFGVLIKNLADKYKKKFA